MLRAVLFDLDRTLLDRDESINGFVAFQFARFASRLPGVSQSAFVDTFVRLDARGTVWKDTVYQQLVDEFRIDSVSWQEFFADFDARVADHYVPFADAHATLRILAQNYRLGLVTNGRMEFQARTIATLGLEPYFQEILVSETEGVRKPDPEIFRRAVGRLGVAPHEAAYVGDRPVSDIQGARDAGMLAIWKRNADFSAVACDGVIDHLAELPELLRRLPLAG